MSLRKRYVVGIVDASEFRFWTARGASKFLSKLNRALVDRERKGRAASVYRYDRGSGWREIW